ncbi:polyketide synthase [Coccidioides immitis RS]|uniref:Non-reducing polyketide synthase nscA n=2 Tax=Coccidioides immitis TaxID=5501 RepID=J3KE05_COCIM|nr:polyketide synthase [Coccidioides immitis RS]EAS33665.3 polyketide synthase [Coccidioides immitis RS]KMP04852.1 phenolpthiocerol synthesis polyketide synthase ppsA [Coccidioides immitis RMSCC 2394]
MDEDYPENAIAVIGMACKFPGAESLEEFWDLLLAGKSMCQGAPSERFATKNNRRHQDKSIYNGNFISSIESFDHKFFRKSGREASSMDPQQRLLLEVAYQALESAGYFGETDPNTDVGCYVGVCASDYNDNVANHPPNAFSTLGTLRAFLTGKISHFFGWTGPSVTFDTACSSSAVAIDAACKAILQGGCHMALAGGVSIFTSPYFFQNLSAASFLSPTGATKSFDADADGYCRGEGVGLVMLKKLSHAVANNDNILGVIMSSAVKQSSNLVPITVPYSPSQTALYRKVLALANVSPEQVTYLEAHGTGTRIGDPQEFQGIKEVFGGPKRQENLYFASVKGNIGHTEGASGVAGLIKTVLMIQKRKIVRQASFQQLNPKIILEGEKLAVPTDTLTWKAETLIGCVNNYGAAGSIAAMVIKEPPAPSTELGHAKPLSRYPIFLSANSPKALSEYAAKLRAFMTRLPPSSSNTLADLACNLSDKQNRSLPCSLEVTVPSMTELDDQLRVVASGSSAPSSSEAPSKPKHVILVFGGQTNRLIGLNKMVLESSPILRSYLDQCDEKLQAFGMQSIYPGIFETEPRDDIVMLQTMQFALQYAVAKTWIDSGLHIDCVLGHSFGQLVALTISGVLSLEDGLKLVHGRALLMAQKWGPERGSMIALDADIETTARLVAAAHTLDQNYRLEIACYNGPRSHVVVGSEAAVQGLVGLLNQSAAVKYKQLNVTHGFHSEFTEPILKDLDQLAKTLTFNQPKIPIETCSEGQSWGFVTPALVTEHTRIPVYFEEAVDRLIRRYGPCTWVEAGSNSSIVSMARRAIRGTASKHSFFPINLSREDAMGSLADTTVNLWKNGHHVQFWPFNRLKRRHYTQINLPPYQFEKVKHWLDWVEVEPASTSGAGKNIQEQSEKEEPGPAKLLSFSGFGDRERRQAVFCIDPRCEEWQRLVQGHAVLQNPLCPAPLYVELVSRAIMLHLHDPSAVTLSSAGLCLRSLDVVAPLGIGHDIYVKLLLTQLGSNNDRWRFAFYTMPRPFRSEEADLPLHATGEVTISSRAEVRSEFERTVRLLPYQHLESLIAQTDGEGMTGSLIYRVFDRVVQYDTYYKGVSRIASKAGEVVAQVILQNPELPWAKEQVSNPLALDNFLQVAGLHVNSLNVCGESNVFVCTKVDRIQFGPEMQLSNGNGSWSVYSNMHMLNDKEVENDIYVFDAIRRQLVMVILGARFNRVLITSLGKVLARANATGAGVDLIAKGFPAASHIPATDPRISKESDFGMPVPPIQLDQSSTIPRPIEEPVKPDLEKELRQLLNKITDVPESEFKDEATLEDLGIDSLMATEIVTEVGAVFKVDIPQSDVQDLITFRALRDYVLQRVAPGHKVLTQTMTATLTEAVLPREKKDNAPKASFAGPNEQVSRRIAQLVASHLECSADFLRSTNLADQGLDSLLCMELATDIERLYGIKIDVTQLTTESTFGDLCDMIIGSGSSSGSSTADDFAASTPAAELTTDTEDENIPVPGPQAAAKLLEVQHAFENIRYDFEMYAKETGFLGFWKNVFPAQSRLVLAYVVEAFRDLGCPLDVLQPGQIVPDLLVLPRHQRLRCVFYEVLRDGQLVDFTGTDYIRSEKPIDHTPSHEIYSQIVRDHPQHAKEHELLNICGSIMASLVNGQKDPLQLLFGTKRNKDLLEDVYRNGPMYLAVTRLLGSFLEKSLRNRGEGKIHVLEVGAGTGATTRWVVDVLSRAGVDFTYTFSDISPSLVAAAKRKFSTYGNMNFMVLDIEKAPPEELTGRFHIILSTNCIHATSSLPRSLTRICEMLRPGGFVSLVEFTKNMFWFDMVFGLLEGWWLFEDGREHVLADEAFWERSMKHAGFKHVAMTDGPSLEANTVRIITGFTEHAVSSNTQSWVEKKNEATDSETLVFSVTDDKTLLRADIHYPVSESKCSQPWPVALLIHGGGHTMLSRKDVHPKQVQYLLKHRILPVSVDYRLCPETTLVDGPMRDVQDAFIWVKTKLPSLKLRSSSYLSIDSDRVAVVGWSTGGTLALSLSWTIESSQEIRPPDAILSFYCPTDYEDPFWKGPNFPCNSRSYADEEIDLLAGVSQRPITAYNVPPSKRATAGWMCPSDARSKIILHMNWRGQTLPVLCNGLPAKAGVPADELKKYECLPQPSPEQIIEISPYAQIVRGKSRSPTYLVHGTDDDLIPWQQAQRTYEALKKAGVPAGISLLEGQPHLFDLFSDADGKKWQAVVEAYAFVFKHVGVEMGRVD